MLDNEIRREVLVETETGRKLGLDIEIGGGGGGNGGE